MKVTIEKNELVIRVQLDKPTPSASGKTDVVASTRGNIKTGCKIDDGREITIGLNAYVTRK